MNFKVWRFRDKTRQWTSTTSIWKATSGCIFRLKLDVDQKAKLSTLSPSLALSSIIILAGFLSHGDIHQYDIETGKLIILILRNYWNYWNPYQISTGWWLQSLWKIWKSAGIIVPNIWKVVKQVPNHQPDINQILYSLIYIIVPSGYD